MKIVVLILSLMIASLHLCAQIPTTWKGGNPGKELDWNTPSNWSNNRVPDEFSDVTISYDNSFQENYPVIGFVQTEIHSLCIHPGAKLNLSAKGGLTIQQPEYSFFKAEQIKSDSVIIQEKHSITFLASTPF